VRSDLVYQVPVEYTRYFEGESTAVPSFVLLYNTRWFEPDSGNAVPFYVNPDNFDPQGGTPPDLSAAVEDALDAWSTISGCSMRYQFMGADTNGCGWGPVDHVSRVSIDCRGEIAGEGCRSIIAVGGGHYDTRQTVDVNGTTYRRIVEADVCLQDGWCDYFQNPVALREVITHELGHCLGLNHSDDRTANMAPFIHNDGRGATLQADDMEGARFIYPGSGGGDGGGGGNTGTEPPVVATSSLPDGRLGEAYATPLAVTNGEAPFAWSRSTGDLPAGVVLTSEGTLVGIPTADGEYAFAVRVTDGLGRVAAAQLTLRVRPPLPVVLGASFRNAKRQLTIVGTHFAAGAQFEINGTIVVPKKPPVFDAAAGSYRLKGSRKKLNLNKHSGTNQVVVIVGGERSQPYFF
jgi:hypothetical protein